MNKRSGLVLLALLLFLLGVMLFWVGTVSARSSAMGGNRVLALPARPVGVPQQGTPTPTPTLLPCNQWSVVPSPNNVLPANYLFSVASVTPGDVWAVGYATDSSAVQQTIVLHWDGTSWALIPSPNNGSLSRLYSVAARSSNDVWAVGSYYSGSAMQPLILHWDGSIWSIIPGPSTGPGQAELYGVTALGAGNIWAVGYMGTSPMYRTLIEHWDGSQWIVTPSPNSGTRDNELFGISGVSDTDIWAAGHYWNGTVHQTLTLHWDGSQWSLISSPNPGSSGCELRAVVAIASNDVWAAGFYSSGTPSSESLSLHWDGAQWNVVPTPALGIVNEIYSLAAVSSADIWAVGGVNINQQRTLTIHWDGNQWTRITSPNVGSDSNSFFGAAVSATDVWAVGYTFLSGPTYSGTLVEQYPRSCGITTTTATPTALMPTSTTTPTAFIPTGTWTPVSTTATPAAPSATASANPPSATLPVATATATATACTITFTDVDQNNPFYLFIRCLACRGIVNGYADGTFRWGNAVTRGQLAKILANAAGLTTSIPSTQQTFEDVPPTNTFWIFVERLAATGAITGYLCGGPGEPCQPPTNRSYFRWTANATRGQISKITAQAARITDPVPSTQQTFTDVPATNTFWIFIERLAGRGIISGYLCGGPGEPCDSQQRAYFRWGSPATRGQMSKIAASTFFPNCYTPVRR